MKKILSLTALSLISTWVLPAYADIDESFEQKMLREYKGQAKIKQKNDKIIKNYRDKSSYFLSSYKQNYFLPVTYGSHKDSETNQNDKIEAQFQISVKYPLMLDISQYGGDLYMSYTNKSNWQLYSSDSSFRETNHEPEIFVDFGQDWEFGGIKNTNILVGYNHQTNGKSDEEARNWDRLFADFVFAHKDFSVSTRIMYPVSESSGTGNKHDLSDYLGYHEINARYFYGDQTFSAKSTWAIKEGNIGLTLGWEKPISPAVSLYVEGFAGYGDTLIDFDEKVYRIGVGFSFSNDLL